MVDVRTGSAGLIGGHVGVAGYRHGSDLLGRRNNLRSEAGTVFLQCLDDSVYFQGVGAS